jgi:hypothetical protein
MVVVGEVELELGVALRISLSSRKYVVLNKRRVEAVLRIFGRRGGIESKVLSSRYKR